MKVKKKKIIETHINFGMFDYGVNCIICDHSLVEKYVKTKFEDNNFYLNENNIPRGWCFKRDGYCPIIWIPNVPKTPQEYATLSHECLHAVQGLFDWAGIKMVEETNEVSAHAIRHLVENILLNANKK